MSKKLAEKQQRRLAEERKKTEQRRAARRRNLITVAVTVVVFAGSVVLILNERKKEGEPVGTSAAKAGCEAVQTHEAMEPDHIAVGSVHDPYNSSPPTSGPHYAAPDGPVDTAFYTDPLQPEQVVHNLEHGQIVIWYRPDVDGDTKDAIERLVEQEPRATVALPYDDIDTRFSYVLTAWGISRGCARPSQEVVDDFRSEYQGKAGPEARLTAPFTK